MADAASNASPEQQQQARNYMIMMDKVTGFYVSQCIYVAAKLGLADQLKDGPLTAEELAERVGADSDALYRVLRVLISEGVFDQLEDGRFTLNDMGYLLRSDLPNSASWWAIHQGEETHKGFTYFLEAIQTGQSVYEKVHGMPLFQYFQQDAEAARVFNRAMGTESGREELMAQVYDFSRFRKLVDVGGGYGKFLRAILAQYPQPEGLVYDLPSSQTGFEKATAEAGLSDRLKFEAGSFFESVPAGGDLYLISLVLHDWSNQKAGQILSNCQAVMQPGQTLLIAEQVIGSDKQPSLGKRLDLNMLVTFGGRERTVEEFRELLDSAGFDLKQIIPTPTRLSWVEAIRR